MHTLQEVNFHKFDLLYHFKVYKKILINTKKYFNYQYHNIKFKN